MEDRQTDHDLLIEMKAILGEVKKGHENHLEHHRKRDIAMLTVTLGALFTAMIAIGTAIISILL